WGRSSAGRAPRSQCGGRGFDPLRLHHYLSNLLFKQALTPGWCRRLGPVYPNGVPKATTMGYKLQAYLRKNRYGTFAFRWRQQRLPEANKEPRWLVGRGKVQHLTRRRSWFAASMHRMKPLDSFEPTLMQSPHGCARSLVLSSKTWIKAVRPPWTAVRSTAQRT